MHASPDEAACEVLEVVPVIIRVIHAEMRAHRGADLSVPQFRALGYVNLNPGTCLSELAEHIGLSLPSMSKLVDGLVGRKLLTRDVPAGDQRRVTLELTAHGRVTLSCAHSYAQAQLSKRLASLSEGDRIAVVHALRSLRPLFVQDRLEPTELAGRHNGHT